VGGRCLVEALSRSRCEGKGEWPPSAFVLKSTDPVV
jgi:hypothetical protein